MANDILLGYGVFNVGGVDIALTRGGGQLTVEETFREILADGDYGPVKGRIVLDASRAKLVVNALEILDTNMTKMYPNLSVTGTSTKTVTGTLAVASTDYNTVTWTGTLLNGKSCVITLLNAINMENIDWTIADKDEAIASLTYTATFDPSTRKTVPWSIQFIDNTLTAPVMRVSPPKAGTTTSLILSFDEALASATYAITDRFALLSSITNDGVAVTITTLANSVQWFNTSGSNPYCVITIASTTFVAGKTVRVNAKASAIADTLTNYIAAATNNDAIVTA